MRRAMYSTAAIICGAATTASAQSVVPNTPDQRIYQYRPAGIAESKPLTDVLVLTPIPAAANEKAAYLGVVAKPLDAARRQQLDLAKRVGILVDQVEPGSPAEQAGIRAGDVIEKLDNQILFDVYQFIALTRSYAGGDEVKLSIRRDAQQLVIAAKLVEKDVPDAEDPTVTPPPAPAVRELVLQEGLIDLTHPAQIAIETRNDGIQALIAVDTTGKRPPKVPPGRLDSLTWSDDENTFEATAIENDKHRDLHLIVKNTDGTIVFDGPINTPDEKKALPKDIADKLESASIAPVLAFMRGEPAATPDVKRLTRQLR